MSWIAIKMLMGDRAKFLGIVIGLTFAAALITQQGSIFCGLMLRTCSQISDVTGADLWVMDPGVRFADDVKPMLESHLDRVRGVDGVKWAVPLYKGNARARLTFDPATLRAKTEPPDARRRERRAPPTPPANVFTRALDLFAPGSGDFSTPPPRWYDPGQVNVVESVVLIGVDDASMVGAPPGGAMVGPGPRGRMWVGDLEDLRRPESIVIDRVGLRKLFPGCHLEEPLADPPESDAEYVARLRAFVRSAPELEMNDRRAVVVGVCEATRTFQSSPVVYTLYSRAKRFMPMERKMLTFILARTADDPSGAKLAPAIVADRIRRATGLGAWTSESFMYRTIKYYLIYTGIPINFGITVFLGFLVGTAIAGQTFYNFTIENIKQFGSLKAMGASNGRIVAMILLQAAIVGAIGYGIGVGLSTLFGFKTLDRWGNPTELAYFTPWQLLPITAAAILFICMLASLLSVQRVVCLEPAVVFRS
ncbi:ABC transporter permease [Planctomyces sp. SH-PL62]|uniref:ABC transporter permease n=1 Tax=Planctomyces sp. SH-PL62 TaxID=1636152 RepID=UPI00078C4C4A|nr:ABC transporter permease [Planctomyces sp. SH-PL62]AMV39769.1 FtsX-like permease family protein [Planctomyces sp. SH-PL62]